jgi:hypothetical protein
VQRSCALALALIGAVGASLSACSQPDSSVLLNISLAPPAPLPLALRITLFGHGRIGAPRLISPADLPGTVLIDNVDPALADFRVLVDGIDGLSNVTSQGATRVTPIFQTEAKADVVLNAGHLPDQDADGVPDVIDDCPTVYDPDQLGCGSASPDLAGGPRPPDFAVSPDLTGAPPADMAVPASLCGSAGVLLCDGFESGKIGSPWSIHTQLGNVSVDSSRAYRGQYSLHAQNNAIGANVYTQATVGESSAFPSDVFSRAFVYVPSGFDGSPAALFVAGQTASPYLSLGLQLEGGSFGTFNATLTPNVNRSVSSPAMPTDRWVCIEWETKISSSGFMKIWVDGTEVTALEGTQSTSSSPSVSELTFGVATQSTGALPARELWLDEIAVDSQRIGCSK